MKLPLRTREEIPWACGREEEESDNLMLIIYHMVKGE
jgi:hypothetical protein